MVQRYVIHLIVIWLAADLGYGDVSTCGYQDIKTTNIDRLAISDIRLVDKPLDFINVLVSWIDPILPASPDRPRKMN